MEAHSRHHSRQCWLAKTLSVCLIAAHIIMNAHCHYLYHIEEEEYHNIFFNVLYLLQSWNIGDAPTNIFPFMLQNRESEKKKEDFIITVGDL